MKVTGTNQESIQAANRALVLCTLQHLRRSSRIELAQRTGLKPATISHIVSDFIDWGLVEETKAFSGTKGRRTIGIRLSDDRFRVVGFRLTRKHFHVGRFTLNCEPVGEPVRVRITDPSPEPLLETLIQTINGAIAGDPGHTYLAVGGAVPGPYYDDTGEIAFISSFKGWENIRIREHMQSRVSVPVVIVQDANAGALAESALDADHSMYSTMVYVAAGQGMGAGIVNGGEVYKGAQGIAGEISHTCVDIDGPLCACGRRGCLENYVSTLAFARYVGERLGRADMTFQEALNMLRAGRPEAAEEFARMMRYMSAAIVNLIYTYNPRRIVIGDELAAAGPLMLEQLKRELGQIRASRLAEEVAIELAGADSDPSFIGAAVSATRYVFNHVATIGEERDSE